MPPPLDDLQVFFGLASDAEARVYAEWASAPAAAARLTGTLRGPECRYAHTLPVTFGFRELPGRDGRLAEAWVPDPCFWTPAMPFLYRYELLAGAGAAQASGLLGIRRLGRQGANLLFDGKRWVLRGAAVARLDATTLSAWHDAALAALVRSLDDELCEAASRVGVLVVADLCGSGRRLPAELARLRRWPAVGMAIVDRQDVESCPGVDLPRLARNLLFAERWSAAEPRSAAPWAHLAVVELPAGDPAETGRRIEALGGLPVVALRPAGAPTDPALLRRECDRLQCDLAAAGVDLAGYLV